MLNERLLAERGIRSRERKDLEALHETMTRLEYQWAGLSQNEQGRQRDTYQFMVKRIEFLMQDAWGFPRNENKHTHRYRFGGLYPAKQNTETGKGPDLAREHQHPAMNMYAGRDIFGQPIEEELPVAGESMTAEKAIEERVVKWARTNGWLAIKFTPKGDVGWPDRIFISPAGVHCWIEFKAPGKSPTPLQEKRMNMLWKQKTVAQWFDNADEAIDYLRAILR